MPQLFQVFAPALVLFADKLLQIGPREQPGVVPVVEGDAYGIVPDAAQLPDLDVRLPPTVTRCSGEWPCTSADGLSTRSSSAGNS